MGCSPWSCKRVGHDLATEQEACVCMLVASVMSDSLDPMDLARQVPLSMGFSRQEYWSGLPCLPPGDFPHPGIEPVSLMSPALADGFFTTSATWEAQQQAWQMQIHFKTLL